jgi:C1A family cysteine protease
MFGFTVYSSHVQAAKTRKIPYPTQGEKTVGGHAIVAAGCDDKMKIKNSTGGAKETTGALLVRNSWSTGWGDKGYGWLPYEYVLKGLADDWRSLLKNEWIDTGNFGSSGTEREEERKRLSHRSGLPALASDFLKLNHCIATYPPVCKKERKVLTTGKRCSPLLK